MEFKQLLLLLLLSTNMQIQNMINLTTNNQYCEFIVTFDYEVTSNELTNGVKGYQLNVKKNMSDFNKKRIHSYYLDSTSLVSRNNCYSYQIGTDPLNNVQMGLTLEVTFLENGGSDKIVFVTSAVAANGTSKQTSIENLMQAVQDPRDIGNLTYESVSGRKILVNLHQQNTVSIDTTAITSQDCMETASPNVRWFNCVPEDIELHNFWYNSISSNWAFWLWIFILMSFFLISVFQDEEMDLTYNREEYWSHHPVYSIRYYITEMFWKRQRLAILYVDICGMCLVLSLLTNAQSDEHLALRLVVFPLIACMLSFIPSFIAGILLRRYINTFRVYINEYKANQSPDYDARNRMLDKFHKTNYRTLLLFYVYCGLFCIGCNVIAIVAVRYETFADMWWYILQVALGVLWDLLFFNVLFVIMARGSDSLHNLMVKRGYYYEKELNDDYREYFKIE